MATFTASTQYGDWSGDVQADDGDLRSIAEKVREGGWWPDGCFLVGVRAYVGENLHNRPLDLVSVRLLFIPASDYSEAQAFMASSAEPIVGAREVRLDLALEEFVRCFKRLCLVLSWQSLNVIGRDFQDTSE
jgi:hypothetical protein